MTTTYLFPYYTLDSQVSLSSCICIKTSLFSFWLSVVSLARFVVLKIITALWKIKKKSGENKSKSRTIHPKNHENFKNSIKNKSVARCRYYIVIIFMWPSQKRFSTKPSWSFEICTMDDSKIVILKKKHKKELGSNANSFNSLMPGGNKKVTHTQTNLQLNA